MIYDTTVELLKILFGTVEFLKPYATTAGILWLILKQHSIRKVINGHLPMRFRDTHDSDIQEMKQNLEEVKYDVRLLKAHQGVIGEWSSIQPNGLKITPILSYKRFFLLLHKVNILRRIKTMNRWTSRKFLMAILAAVLPIINEEFKLGLDTNVVIAAIGGIVAFILGEAHVDAKKIAGGNEDAKYSNNDGPAV